MLVPTLAEKLPSSFCNLHNHVVKVWGQARINVANDYPTFESTTLVVVQKLTFSRQITLNVRQNLSVWMKNMQILG